GARARLHAPLAARRSGHVGQSLRLASRPALGREPLSPGHASHDGGRRWADGRRSLRYQGCSGPTERRRLVPGSAGSDGGTPIRGGAGRRRTTHAMSLVIGLCALLLAPAPAAAQTSGSSGDKSSAYTYEKKNEATAYGKKLMSDFDVKM